MRFFIFSMFFTLIFPMATHAQEVKTEPLADDVYQRQPYDISPYIMHDMISAPDTLHLPDLDDRGRVMSQSFYPYYFGGSWSNWRLHEGLNLSLGASIFSQIGKHAYGGVGFTQNLSAQYATALSPKLSLAVGGYLDNMYWANSTFRDAGLTAVLGYKFDEHWEGYLYAQKSIVTNTPIPLYIQLLSLSIKYLPFAYLNLGCEIFIPILFIYSVILFVFSSFPIFIFNAVVKNSKG